MSSRMPPWRVAIQISQGTANSMWGTGLCSESATEPTIPAANTRPRVGRSSSNAYSEFANRCDGIE